MYRVLIGPPVVVNLALIAAAIATGCSSPTVRLTDDRPAVVYVEGLRRIVVCNFEGPRGDLAAHRLTQEFQATGQFEVVPQAALQNVVREPLYDRSGRVKQHVAIDAARRLDVDALLLGKVTRVDPRGDGGFKIDSPTAGVVLEYRLVEARTGFLRDANSLRYETEASRPESDVEAALTVCTKRLVKNFAAHQVPIEVPLACTEWSKGSVREGIECAEQGDWQQARRCWNQALARHPDNHAAVYNLGVAAEAAGDFAGARWFYQRASTIHSQQLYTDGIARADRRAEQARIAQHQLADRFATAHQPPFSHPGSR